MRSLWERFEPLRDRAAEAWALWSILAAQATLTLPWMWRTGAYYGEALYIGAGRAEWAHWLHHAALPPSVPYATYFPGSPDIYPPVAAVFDAFGSLLAGEPGGLAAARILSLIFMLGATALIYLMGDRLFGRMSGVLAALLFAVCGIIVHLGAAATFDPMALFLLVLALHAAVRMRDGGIGWLVLCPLALSAANATKYPTTAWDPLILGTIILYGWSKGRTQSIALAASVAVTTAMIDGAIVIMGGANLATGIVLNTIERSPRAGMPSSPGSVLNHAMLMTGLIVLIALGGIWVSIVKRMPGSATAFLCLLVFAALVVPIDQARLHQITSLDENMGFGLPFASLAAGYALGAWRQWLGRQRHWGQIVATTAAVITVIVMLIVGRVEHVQFRGPAAAKANSPIWPIVHRYYIGGSLVLDSGSAATGEFYLQDIPAGAWHSFNGRPPVAIRQLVEHRCFSVVIVDASDAPAYSHLRELLTSSHYRRLKTAPVVNKKVWIWRLPLPLVTLSSPSVESSELSVSSLQHLDTNPCE